MSGWKDPYGLATLAAAQGEAGDFVSAVEWQSKANSLYSDREEKTKGKARLKLYQEKQPYRDTQP